MNKHEAQKLINKYLNGTCTPEEKLLVERWYNEQLDAAEPISTSTEIESIGERIYGRLPSTKKNNGKKYYSIAAAAIILVALSFSVNQLFIKEDIKVADQSSNNEIGPGGNKAYLTLSNGERISLTDAENGDIANQSGITITKNDDGQLVYNVANIPIKDKAELTYNTISTPKGGQFKVMLPDGSNVWLNAETSLTYPTTFVSLGEREVDLKGEAYFEVAHDPKKRFIVHTISSAGINQDIEVLGTDFNVSNYDNEEEIKTTLLEGSVRIETQEGQVNLKPKQQSRLGKRGLSVVTADTEEATAWKNGYFMFDDESLESIMRKIARWYDVEVEFEETNKEQVFSGTVSKFTDVSKVLNKLELTGGVHFEIKGRRIIVN